MKRIVLFASIIVGLGSLSMPTPSISSPFCWATGRCPIIPKKPPKPPCWATGDCSIIPDAGDLSQLWLDIRNNALNPITQRAFAATFAPVYASTVFNAVLARNPSWEYLTEEQKQKLGPYVGNIVDTARIHYESVLPDNITILRKDFRLMEGSLAQTYCADVFVAGPNKGGSEEHIRLLHHELIHYDQCVRKGGMSQFGFDYGLGYIKANFSYEDNVMEAEARQKAESATYQATITQPSPNPQPGIPGTMPPPNQTPTQAPSAIGTAAQSINTIQVPYIIGNIVPSNGPNPFGSPFVAHNSYGGLSFIWYDGRLLGFSLFNFQTGQPNLYDAMGHKLQ